MTSDNTSPMMGLRETLSAPPMQLGPAQFRVTPRSSVGHWTATIYWRVEDSEWQAFQMSCPRAPDIAQISRAVEDQASVIRSIEKSRCHFWETVRVLVYGRHRAECREFIRWLLRSAPNRFRASDEMTMVRGRRSRLGENSSPGPGRASVILAGSKPAAGESLGDRDIPVYLSCDFAGGSRECSRARLRQALVARIEILHLKSRISVGSEGRNSD